MFDCYLDETSLSNTRHERIGTPAIADVGLPPRGHPHSRIEIAFHPGTVAGSRQQILAQIAKLVAEPVEFSAGRYGVRAITFEQALQINRLVGDWALVSASLVAEHPGRLA
ncbi:hypothetical protein [Chitinivorax sp. B]|uniref:hypothetical protein n=1 Tax=Chitinivorax sp. B TaxID=2502235 RepID=UPI0010F44FFF|nr:hypothetical protein [Chitinivorax sp. B]